LAAPLCANRRGVLLPLNGYKELDRKRYTHLEKKGKKVKFSDSFQGYESTTIGANTCGDYLFFSPPTVNIWSASLTSFLYQCVFWWDDTCCFFSTLAASRI